MPKKSEILNSIEIYHRFHVFPQKRIIDLATDISEEGEEMGVGFSMSYSFIKNLNILEALSDDPITVYLNTEGGDCYQGMAIYDSIKASKCHVSVIVRGACMSMGSVVLQAGHERILSPNSAIMFHSGQSYGAGNPHEATNMAAFGEAYSKRLDNILFSRIQEKRAKDNQAPMSKKTFDLLNLKSKWMFAEEAVDLGLADRIEGSK